MAFHRTRTLFAALALAVAPPVAAQAGPAATVTAGDGGGYVLGNPAAPVKLVEYISYTCPHCATFARESGAVLNESYIRRGTVSVEIRHLVRDPVDMAMAVAANCGSPTRFASRHHALMAQQAAILGRVRALPRGKVDAWRQGTPAQRLRRVAGDAGVTGWMRTRGFTPAQIDACFADDAMHDRIVTMTNTAREGGVPGTPSFAINGALLANVHGWSALRPRIDAALAAQ